MTAPTYTFTVPGSDGSVATFTLTITGKAQPPHFDHLEFVPADPILDYLEVVDIQVLAVDQFGAKTPASIASAVSNDTNFTVSVAGSALRVTYVGPASPVDVVADITGEAS